MFPNRIHGIRCFVVIFAVSLGSVSNRSAAEPAGSVKDPAPERAEFVIRGMLKEREGLERGIVRISGEKHSASADQEDVNGPMKGLCAFDFPKGLLRYDNEEPMLVTSVNAQSVAAADNDVQKAVRDASPTLTTAMLRYLRNAEYSASWNRTSPHSENALSLRKVEVPMGGNLAAYHHFSDIRASGLLEYMALTAGSMQEGVTVRQVCENLLSLQVAAVLEKDGLMTVTFKDSSTERTLIVDVDHGFTPREFVVKDINSPAVQTTKCEWAQKGQLWVPTRVTLELEAPHIEMSGHFRMELEWESINEPVDPSYFDFMSFDIPQEADVIDMRSEKAVRMGTLKDGVLVPPEVPKFEGLNRKGNRIAGAEGGRRTFLLIVGNGLAAATVILWVIWRRRRRSAGPN